MNLGLIGLLGLLQTAVPQDTTLKDSIMALMDSVAPAVNYEGTRINAALLYTQGQSETHLSICNHLSRKSEKEQISVSVGLCRKMLEPGQNRPAILVSGVTKESPNVFHGIVVVDWDKDYDVDVCYRNSFNANDKKGEIQFINPKKCLPLYHDFLKKFERYK